MPARKKGSISKARYEQIIAGVGGPLPSRTLANKQARQRKKDAKYKADMADLKRKRVQAKSERITDLFANAKNPETSKYLQEMARADRDSAQLGEARNEKKSLFNRTIDVLSRGNYAAAEAFKEAFDPNTKDKWEVGEGFKGFWSGLQGKEKTTFKDVLNQHGVKGKKSDILGFAGDVLLDPLTWTGVGAVAKAGKGKDVVKLVNNAADIEKKYGNTAGATPEIVRAAIQSDKLPVQAIKKRQLKNLTPEGKELYNAVLDTKPAGRAHFVDTTVKRFTKSQNAYVRERLGNMPEPKVREVITSALRKQLKKRPGLAGALDRIEPFDWDNPSTMMAANRHEGWIRVGGSMRKMDTADAIRREEIGENWASVTAKTPEEFIESVVVHEVGHHVAYNLSDEAIDGIRASLYAKAGASGLDEAAGSDKVRQYLSDNLSEYSAKNIHETLAEAWAEAQLSKNPRPLAKYLANEMDKYVPKTPTKRETNEILDQLAKDYVYNKTGKIEGMVDGAIKLDPAEVKLVKEDLLAQTARNIDAGDIRKEFRLKLGPTSVGIPKVYEGGAKVANKLASIPGIKQSVDKFNQGFRVKAHIPPGLDHLRAKTTGSAMFLVTQHIKLLQSVFNNVPKASRSAVLKALRDGAEQGNAIKGGLDINGNPVEDLVSYVKTGIQALDIDRLKNGLTNDEINAFIGKNYKITEPPVTVKTETVEQVDEYGRPYSVPRTTSTKEPNPNVIMDSLLKNPKIKDPAQALFVYSAAVNQAIAKRTMYDTVAQTWGVPKNEIGEKLAKDHGWVEVKGVPNTEGFLFPPDVAKGIEKVNEVFADARSTGDFIQYYDRALQGFKSVVTRYNPSFHSRTFLGEMLLGYMGGMKSIPRSYSKAGRVIKGRNEQFYGTPEGSAEAFGENAPKRLIQASNAMRGVMPTGDEGAKTIIRRKFNNEVMELSADKIWSLYLETGLKSGYAATDLIRGTEVSAAKFAKTRDVMQSFTEGVEDYGRLAHFIDVLQHSKAKTLDAAVEEASQIVRKYHLDYTSVTNFEKNVMTRAMPFYKWMRLSTPVMAEILFTQPGKALALPKAMRDLSEMAGYDPENFGPFPGGADAVIPHWMRDHGAVPMFEFGGNTNYFDPTATFPLAGSMETAEQGGTNMLTPALKIAADLIHGKDKFGNQLRGENASAEDWKNYTLAQTPQTNFGNQMVTKKDPGIPRIQTLLQFLVNPGIQPNTEKRQQGEAFRQRQEAYSHRRRLKNELGIE